MKISSYQHVSPGRLRIKITQVKGSEEIAQEVECILKQVEGINSVTANPLTGNVLALFDPQSLTHDDLIEILVAHRYLKSERRASQKPKRSPLQRLIHPEEVSKTVADVLLQSAVEFAVRRALLAFI